MVRVANHLGTIDISHEFLANLVSSTVTDCFGVAGMSAAGAQQGMFNRIVKKDATHQGVRVRYHKSKLIVELHIIVTYGTNVSAVVKSIMHKVQYTVEEITGLPVAKVNVFVDGMKTL